MPGAITATAIDVGNQTVPPRTSFAPYKQGPLRYTTDASGDFPVREETRFLRLATTSRRLEPRDETGDPESITPDADTGRGTTIDLRFQRAVRAGADAVFEDGVDTEYARRLRSLVRDFGRPAVRVLRDYITDPTFPRELAAEALTQMGQVESPLVPSRTRWPPYEQGPLRYTTDASGDFPVREETRFLRLATTSRRLEPRDETGDPESITPDADTGRGTTIDLRFQRAVRAGADAVFEDGVDTEYARRLRSLVRDFGRPAVRVLRDYITDPTFPRELAAEALTQMGQVESPSTREARVSLLIQGLSAAYPSVRDAAATALMNVAVVSDRDEIQTALENEAIFQIRESLRGLLQDIADQHDTLET